MCRRCEWCGDTEGVAEIRYVDENGDDCNVDLCECCYDDLTNECRFCEVCGVPMLVYSEIDGLKLCNDCVDEYLEMHIIE